MSENTIRVLGKDISRRDALKVGGLAGLGLAFSKPLIEAVRPHVTWASTNKAQANTGVCEESSRVEGSSITILIMDGTYGIANIEVLEKSGVWYSAPSYTPGTTDPILFTVNKFGSSSYIKIEHTAGNGVSATCEFTF